MTTTVDDLIGLLPQGLQADQEAETALVGMLTPVARVDSLLARKVDRLAELLDPARVPDDLVIHLAGLVGVGVDLPAAAGASTDDLRKLTAVAVALWKSKGTASSWRSVLASLAGSRAVILDWFYTRTVAGSSGERHTIPAPGTGSGSYANPERVSDVWYQDPAGTADTDLIARFLDVCRASGERINLYRADLVDDFGAGLGQWTWDGTGAVAYDPEAWELEASDGATLSPTVALEATWTPWGSGHLFQLLAVTGTARTWIRSSSTAGVPTNYEIRIDQAGAMVYLYGTIAGVVTTLASAATGPIVPGFPYRWTIEAWDGGSGAGSTTVRVYREGVKLIDHVDATVNRAKTGAVAWGSYGSGDRATCSTLILWPAGIAPTRIGLAP
jgi:hypothetical protein